MNITAAEFIKVANFAVKGSGGKGRHWSEKTIAIARALLIDEKPAKEIAEKFAVSREFIYNVRRRFLLKAQTYQLNQAAAKLRPSKATGKKALSPHQKQIKRFLGDGYTFSEIKRIFSVAGFSVSVAEIKRIASEAK
jgi:DNA-binding CsgD family transcriptional regulator